MSNTEIYGFNKDGNAYLLSEIRNSWRGGMAVWDILYKKYYGTSFAYAMWNDGFKNINKALFGSSPAPKYERIVYLTTCDNAIVMRENFKEAIEAFRKFEGETSLREQADAIEAVINDENCVAIGWCQTSVNADNWGNCGGYNEDTDECIPYNIYSGDKHWDVFKEVEAQ